MRPGRSLISMLAWDGFLPLGVAAIPFLVKLTIPRNDGAKVVAAFLIPVIAAVARSSMIAKQLAQACGGRRPWHRQLLAAAAIGALLIFEIGVGIATFGGNVKADEWALTAVYYIVYVLLIWHALRPVPHNTWMSRPEEDWEEDRMP